MLVCLKRLRAVLSERSCVVCLKRPSAVLSERSCVVLFETAERCVVGTVVCCFV